MIQATVDDMMRYLRENDVDAMHLRVVQQDNPHTVMAELTHFIMPAEHGKRLGILTGELDGFEFSPVADREVRCLRIP